MQSQLSNRCLINDIYWYSSYGGWLIWKVFLYADMYCVFPFSSYPQKRVQRAILHELSHNHHWPTLGDHAFQTDNVGVVELAHDRSLWQEVSPLPISVAHLESLDGYNDLPASGQLEATATHLPKLSCQSPGETDRYSKRRGRKWKGERGMMEEWRRVGEKRGEGTVNWLEPRSQGRMLGGVEQGELQETP